MAWTKIRSGKGASWSWVVYESDVKEAKKRYKTMWTPTAKCKKEWKKHGGIAKKHTTYSDNRGD